MTTDWVNIISAVGFPIVLVLLGVNFITKHLPTFLTEWRRFTVANENFAKAVEMNTAITTKHFDKYVTVEDHLVKAIELLKEHHVNAVGIKADMSELKGLFIEMATLIQELQGEK